MKIGGLQKFSLLDYPGHLAAIIFTQGCNFRCQFCYNPMLVGPIAGEDKLHDNFPPCKGGGKNKEGQSFINEEALFEFLKKRQKKLDAVVITGGEPTIHDDLREFIFKIKKYNFKVKLDTNGTMPEILEKLIKDELIDYSAMDLKAAPKKYDLVTGVQPNLNNIKKSIKIIMSSNLPYEFRTTVVPGLIEEKDIADMGKMIKGADKWFLQAFKSDIDLVNESFKGEEPFSLKEMEKMRKIAASFVKECKIR